jgi:hypothetical protein
MAKLDEHAELIKRLYAECCTAKGTFKRLLREGVDTCYESVRSWLRKHADELPPLRSGGGKPPSKPVQLFGFIPQNAKWVPDADMFPEFFHVLTPDASDEYKAAFLTASLLQFGIETSIQELEATRLPLKRFRCLCDLELYLLAYLLGQHGALVGVSAEAFGAATRSITPMAAILREMIARRNSITVGELRQLIRRS